LGNYEFSKSVQIIKNTSQITYSTNLIVGCNFTKGNSKQEKLDNFKYNEKIIILAFLGVYFIVL
jgi:hypothetical protein